MTLVPRRPPRLTRREEDPDLGTTANRKGEIDTTDQELEVYPVG